MANTLTGRVHEVRPTQQIPSRTGDKVFLKRELILDCTRYDQYTGERGYDNYPCVTFTQEKCQLLDTLRAGEVVTVSIDIQGKKDPNSERYYNDVRGYKVEVRGREPRPVAEQKPAETTANVWASAPGVAPQPGPVNDLPW